MRKMFMLVASTKGIVAPLRESKTADTGRPEAGLSDSGRLHENATCGIAIVGDVQAVDPTVTEEGGDSAPKFEPETERAI